MGSTLGPILAIIFVVELERTILPIFREHMSPWKRNEDGTISYIKEESIEHVSPKLNGYHDNIKFAHDIEKDGKSPSLDVLRDINGYPNWIIEQNGRTNLGSN